MVNLEAVFESEFEISTTLDSATVKTRLYNLAKESFTRRYTLLVNIEKGNLIRIEEYKGKRSDGTLLLHGNIEAHDEGTRLRGTIRPLFVAHFVSLGVICMGGTILSGGLQSKNDGLLILGLILTLL